MLQAFSSYFYMIEFPVLQAFSSYFYLMEFFVLQAFSTYFYLMEFLNLTSTDVIGYTDFITASRSLCAMDWQQVSFVFLVR